VTSLETPGGPAAAALR